MTQIQEFNRVFTPFEADDIYYGIGKRKFKRAFDTALNTGMRYKELKLFAENPEWHRPKYNEIFLPKTANKNRIDRHVHLTENFNKFLGEYLDAGLYFPARRTWFDSIRRWAKRAGVQDQHNINVKTTRKTWESWLIKANYDPLKVMLSQGHTQGTAILHYLNMSFTKDEIEAIKKKTLGWTG